MTCGGRKINCDGAHAKHEEETRDVRSLIIKKKDASANQRTWSSLDFSRPIIYNV